MTACWLASAQAVIRTRTFGPTYWLKRGSPSSVSSVERALGAVDAHLDQLHARRLVAGIAERQRVGRVRARGRRRRPLQRLDRAATEQQRDLLRSPDGGATSMAKSRTRDDLDRVAAGVGEAVVIAGRSVNRPALDSKPRWSGGG